MVSKTTQLYQVLKLVRPLHQYSAKAVADALAEHEVTMPMRAVLERLADVGTATVPQIARALWLPRQVVQRLADQATTLGLVQWQPNPEHRRSKLASLTDGGTRTFTELHDAELADLSAIARELSAADIQACLQVMTVLTDGTRRNAERRGGSAGWSTPGPLPGEPG